MADFNGSLDRRGRYAQRIQPALVVVDGEMQQGPRSVGEDVVPDDGKILVLSSERATHR